MGVWVSGMGAGVCLRGSCGARAKQRPALTNELNDVLTIC